MTDAPAPLYVHKKYDHEPRNINDQHQEEMRQGINSRVAVWITDNVGTMQTAYIFAGLAIIGLFGVLAILNPSVYTFIAWLSQTFLQLVLLPVIMVGQNVLNRHAQLQADEMFHNVQRTLNDSEQMTMHLEAQDRELVKQTAILAAIQQNQGKELEEHTRILTEQEKKIAGLIQNISDLHQIVRENDRQIAQLLNVLKDAR